MNPLKSYARLCLWVPAARLAAFEAAYQARALPVLKQHGLVEATERGRQTAAGVFSRLFAVEGPAEVIAREQALRSDPAWQEVLQHLGTLCAAPEGLLRWHLGVYTAPAGQGKTVEAVGQRVLAGPGTAHWRTYDIADGLPGVIVHAILQDREGYLWFVTWSGVSRYDGHRFITFTAQDGLASNQARTGLQDREGHLWFGTQDGACRYDGHSFTTFTTQDGLGHNHVRSILQDQEGCLWFGTDGGGVSRCDGQSFTTFTTQDGLASNQVRVVFQDREGHLWFGTWNKGLSRYDGQSFTTFTTQDGLPHLSVSSIFQDQEGCLWFGTDGGVCRYDGRRFTTLTTQDGLAHNEVSAIFQDQEGYFWFGTWNQGVSRYDGQSFTTFTTQDGLPHPSISSIFQDREGYLWFGTWGGVCRYDNRQFTTFTTQDGLRDSGVWSICEDRGGHLWFGTYGGGVSRYDGRHLTNFRVQDDLADNRVWAICEDREGHLWFGTYGGGVCRYDGQHFTTFTTQDGLADNRVRAIFQDREGCLWFGTEEGASRYDGQGFTTFAAQDGLADSPIDKGVRAIFQDREGCLWFGTWGGVSRYNGQCFTTFTTQDGLADNRVRAIFQDQEGYLWFGTEGGGASRYDGQGFTTFAAQDGLALNVVAIAQDQRGHLWFSTYGGGVCRYDGHTFQTLLHQDGLASNLVRPILQDQQGHLWLGTNKGATRFDPPAPVPPPVFIDTIAADRRYERTGEVIIPSRAKLVAFEFHGISFKTRPGALKYGYRLQGHEEDWQFTDKERVEYQDLPLGTYIFQVRAIDRDLNYSAPASSAITLLPDPHLRALTEALSGVAGQFVGQSRALGQVQADLAQVALTDLTVLILGETGTGKGLAARAIHDQSPHRTGPFIPVNCGAIPKDLVGSELFGHERGAFTGATSRKLGKFELAEGGTLFLDEIGDLPLGSQMSLLQLLQEKTFQRVGGKEVLRGDVRIIAATNRDLEAAVQRGEFRKDLFYRLNGFVVELPPLRQRREDILLLAEYFTRAFARHLSRPAPAIDPEAAAYLEAYSWPGNVRELEHLIQRAVLLCKGDLIRREDLAVPSPAAREEGALADGALEAMLQNDQGSAEGDLLERAEEVVLRLALAKAQGNKTRAAALLRTDRKKVERRAKKYRLGE